MATTLDATLAGRNSNSYVELAYCNDYWTNHYSTTKAALWSGLSDPKKIRVLIQACGVIERFKFTVASDVRKYLTTEYNPSTGRVVQIQADNEPVKSDYYQRLQFPRIMDYDVDGAFFVPDTVKDAQCEQAVYLLSFDDSAISSRLQGITHDALIVGSLRVVQNFTAGGTLLAPMALELLTQYLLKGTAWKRA